MAHERWLHDARRQWSAAHVHLHTLTGGGGHPCQPDGARQHRRERAAGYLTLADPRNEHALVTAQHRPLIENQADLSPLAAVGTDALEHRASDEIARRGVEGDRPSESGLERMCLLIHVVAVEIEPGLQ